MDKAQALHNFWSGFNMPAYDELTVPDNAALPYITYEVKTDSFENKMNLSASIWNRSTSWAAVEQKAAEIAQFIQKQNPCTIRIDGGRMYIVKGTPFAQRMLDPSDDGVRRIVLSIDVEFLTEF